MRDKLNSLFDGILLAAAVGLLIFTFVYGSKMATGAEAPYVLEFSEGDCEGLGQALAEAYVAAGQEIPLVTVREHIANFHFGPAVKPADKEYVLQTVDRVYAEYPETTTGKQVIMECFANAESRPKGPSI